MTKIIFNVPVAKTEYTNFKGNVIMSASYFEFNEIIILDRIKFINYFCNGKGRFSSLAVNDKNVWINDYKFKYAIDGFNADSPVPLANMTFDFDNNIDWIDGVTRTLFLLVVDAEYMPVLFKNKLNYNYALKHLNYFS